MRKYISVLLAAILLFCVAGCSGGQKKGPDETPLSDAAPSAGTEAVKTETEPVPETEAGQKSMTEADGSVTFTMYFVDPDSSPYAEGGRKIAELVSEATDGRILIEVEAGSGMGERELVGQAMDNKIDIATCANSVLTNYIPQMNILDQAYLWESADEAHAAVDGAIGDLIRENAEKLGLHVIGFEESGFRNTFSTRPIESIDDFKGVVIRTMENKYHQAAFESFGAEPIGMPYPEVLDALKTGKINACENATVNCLNSGYYEYTDHVTNTRHAFVYILLLMSDEAWNRIPEELKDPFADAVRRGVQWERERLEESNREVAQKLTDLGVQFHEIDTAQLKKAYQAIAKEKGFNFDPEWERAVDEAVREASEKDR